ncbi:MAG: ABC transporter ATP-binding protein [Halanaerobiales bacterium]|nr:ABC transporter ATP-binding protein [Halanaerobiales bacterium]
MAETIISTSELTKNYGDLKAVNGLDLDIKKGEIYGLLGPNGAGKTTTILMLLGLTEPSSGLAEIKGLNTTRDSIEVKKFTGYLPDQVGFYNNSSGKENLIYTAKLNGLDAAAAAQKAEEMIKMVGLENVIDDRVDTYSKGMRQRLGLADVLIKDPEIIILDEPTIGIDPTGINEFLDLIRSLSKENGITVLLSSHLLNQVQKICDRVGIFVKGQLLAEGSIEDLADKLLEEKEINLNVKIKDYSEQIVEKIAELDEVLEIKEQENLLDEIYQHYFKGGEVDARL